MEVVPNKNVVEQETLKNKFYLEMKFLQANFLGHVLFSKKANTKMNIWEDVQSYPMKETTAFKDQHTESSLLLAR